MSLLRNCSRSTCGLRVTCIGTGLLCIAVMARAGVVSLVSQDRFVTVTSPPLNGGSTPQVQTIQAAPSDFGPFDHTVVATDPMFGQTAHATQSSSLTVTSTGALFSANGIAVVDNIMAGAGGQSSFKVVFDVNSPALYSLSYDQSNSSRFPPSTAHFDGPSGFGTIPTGLPAISGTLAPGQYTLDAATTSGSSFDLQLNVGTTSAVPLPPAAWSALAALPLILYTLVFIGRKARGI